MMWTTVQQMASPRIDELRRRHGVPGVSAVALTGSEHALICSGTDPATGRPVTKTTRFQLGSVSKPIAAITAASLAAAIDWDAPLEVIAPLTASTVERNGHHGALTVARLVSHTAGLGVHGFLGYGPGESIPSLADVIAGRGNSDRIAVEVEPGTEYRYSGGGYVVLEAALQEVTGQGFDALVGQAVFAPAAMATASYQVRSGDSAGAINGAAMAEHSRRFPERAAAGVWASAEDLAGLLRALARALRTPDDAFGAAVARVVTPAVRADGRHTGSGHGIDLLDVGGRRWFTHGGRNLGFCARVLVDESGSRGAAVVTNSFPEGSDLAAAVIATLAEDLGWPGRSPLGLTSR
jgi:CubicO group peptidase (beta-lactamase class C family)